MTVTAHQVLRPRGPVIERSSAHRAKVVIEHSGQSGKGKLVVAYNSLDELDGILAHIH